MVLEKSTILYIDDDLVNLQYFSICFVENYNVITLPSTQGAVEVLRNNQVKVIISDQCMPDETGINFIKRINFEYPDIIKIILTADSSKDTVVEAINDAAIYKYLLKPWNRETVLDIIDGAVREYDYKREKKELLIELKKKNEDLFLAYERMKADEKKFRAVFSNSNDSKYILNQDKQIVEANNAFLELIGEKDNLSLEEINSVVRSKFPVLIDKPVELSKGLNSSIAELEISLGPGETRFIEINSNEINYDNHSHILSIVRDIGERRMFEKKIVETIIRTQEEEQNKYARELHDGLGPLLSTLKMHLEWISNPGNSMNKNKIIQHSIFTLDQAIRSVKEIANNLSPHILQRFGLVNAVSEYIERIKETSNITFEIFSSFNQRMRSNTEVSLYRIILECINNSLKHSQATKIIVKFIKQNDSLKIVCSDNGKGFDVLKETSAGRGMGLFNIQSRIKHIGGEFHIVSDENGTEIIIDLLLI